MTNFVQTLVSTAASIESSANRALGLIANAKATISQLRRQIDVISHGGNSMTYSTVPHQQAIDTYSNIQYIHETVAATVPMSQYLSQMQSQFEAIALTIPIARYLVKKGDTLQNISIEFYGVSDYWSNIYDHNLLQSTVLTEGAVLEIPKVT